MRVSYSGYYTSLPRMRRQFDSAHPLQMLYDLIIIGSGAAGLSAGIYAQRFNLKTLIIGKNFGGYTLTAGKIENYPGFLSIDGLELMQKMKEQAEVLGAEIKEEEVKEIKKENDIFKINDHKARMIIIATGTYRKKLGLKNQDIPGVHYCMTWFFKPN